VRCQSSAIRRVLSALFGVARHGYPSHRATRLPHFNPEYSQSGGLDWISILTQSIRERTTSHTSKLMVDPDLVLETDGLDAGFALLGDR
jgi:hypothetical protein